MFVFLSWNARQILDHNIRNSFHKSLHSIGMFILDCDCNIEYFAVLNTYLYWFHTYTDFILVNNSTALMTKPIQKESLNESMNKYMCKQIQKNQLIRYTRMNQNLTDIWSHRQQLIFTWYTVGKWTGEKMYSCFFNDSVNRIIEWICGHLLV